MRAWELRYDMRAYGGATPLETLYRTAIEQCAWADERGAARVLVNEHHGSADGYLPSPLVFAGGIATRTQHARIRTSALVLTLRDPLQAAEDVIVLDHLSNGRIEIVCVAGYVESEFSMFSVNFNRRAVIFEEKVAVFTQALTGQVFERNGISVQVTPRPLQRPRPPVLLGGATPRAARRAAQLADGFMPVTHDPKLYELYLAERSRLGLGPGDLTRRGGPLFLHVTDDPERAWARIAPHAMLEINAYAAWNKVPNANAYASWREQLAIDESEAQIDDADVLRNEGVYAVLTPDECVSLVKGMDDRVPIMLHPLMGGLAPELAWESLELFVSRVLPRISEPKSDGSIAATPAAP